MLQSKHGRVVVQLGGVASVSAQHENRLHFSQTGFCVTQQTQYVCWCIDLWRVGGVFKWTGALMCSSRFGLWRLFVCAAYVCAVHSSEAGCLCCSVIGLFLGNGLPVCFTRCCCLFSRITHNCHDDSARFVRLLATNGRNYLVEGDFESLVQVNGALSSVVSFLDVKLILFLDLGYLFNPFLFD